METQCLPAVMHVEGEPADMEVRVPIVHRFNHQDFAERHEIRPGQMFARLKPEDYVITFEGGDITVPQNVRDVAGAAKAVDTEGRHCACAVHAVFGKPSSTGKLAAPNARELARDLMSEAPRKAAVCPEVDRRQRQMVDTFWEEFVLRTLSEEATAEGRCSGKLSKR